MRAVPEKDDDGLHLLESHRNRDETALKLLKTWPATGGEGGAVNSSKQNLFHGVRGREGFKPFYTWHTCANTATHSHVPAHVYHGS